MSPHYCKRSQAKVCQTTDSHQEVLHGKSQGHAQPQGSGLKVSSLEAITVMLTLALLTTASPVTIIHFFHSSCTCSGFTNLQDCACLLQLATSQQNLSHRTHGLTLVLYVFIACGQCIAVHCLLHLEPVRLQRLTATCAPR